MVKKNGQKVVTVRPRRRRSFKTKVNTPQYAEWLREALRVVKQSQDQVSEPIKCRIHAKFLYFFENRMSEPDLSNLHEGIQDVLKTCGIIEDDILIESHDGSRKRFYQTPRLEVELFEFLEPIDVEPPRKRKAKAKQPVS
ncbi:RusA family crossover junction endodeoxyribonuclease [Bdellovibrio bacteriovorus]|uniref:RusA family crossover junction endodeoxyribonuclease n=1 Tax=Bdellovibrio bacteriovorus TaxID=959 RepID=UPI003AA9882D